MQTSCHEKFPDLPKIVLVVVSCRVASKRKFVRPTLVDVVGAPAGQRLGGLADVGLGVGPAVGAEREQLHDLAGVVLVRRALAVVDAVEEREHRRVDGDVAQQVGERAERRAAEERVLAEHQVDLHRVAVAREPVVPDQRHALDQRLVAADHAVQPPEVVVAVEVVGLQRAAVAVLRRGADERRLADRMDELGDRGVQAHRRDARHVAGLGAEARAPQQALGLAGGHGDRRRRGPRARRVGRRVGGGAGARVDRRRRREGWRGGLVADRGGRGLAHHLLLLFDRLADLHPLLLAVHLLGDGFAGALDGGLVLLLDRLALLGVDGGHERRHSVQMRTMGLVRTSSARVRRRSEVPGADHANLAFEPRRHNAPVPSASRPAKLAGCSIQRAPSTRRTWPWATSATSPSTRERLGDDAVGAGADVVGLLAAGHPVAPEVPAGARPRGSRRW